MAEQRQRRCRRLELLVVHAEQVEALREALEAAQARLREAQAQHDASQDEFRRLDAELGRLEARRRALAETQARCSGEAREGATALWPRLEVAAGWETAAETLLGPWLGARLAPLSEATVRVEHAPRPGEAWLGFGPEPDGALPALASAAAATASTAT